MRELAGRILEFWFGDVDERGWDWRWFMVDEAFDRRIRERFEAPLRQVAGRAGQDGWDGHADTWLAYIILTDQFPRNIHRGRALAFAFDHLALAMARRGLELGFDRELDAVRRVFAYLPFEHSEAPADQRRSCELFRQLAESAPAEQRERLRGSHQYALEHRDIIERFGRFPHRNSVLGRESTADELAYLETASGFGQLG